MGQLVCTYQREMNVDVKIKYEHGMLERGSTHANNHSSHKIWTALIPPNMDIARQEHGCIRGGDGLPLLIHELGQSFASIEELLNYSLLKNIFSSIRMIRNMCGLQLQDI